MAKEFNSQRSNRVSTPKFEATQHASNPANRVPQVAAKFNTELMFLFNEPQLISSLLYRFYEVATLAATLFLLNTLII